jgi:ribosomal-protein-alanine N-acetyltransferase
MVGLPLDSYPVLVTERLRLREIVNADAADILHFRGDRETQKYNTVPMRDEAEARSLIRTMQSWYVTRQAIQWGITLLEQDRVIGICGVHDWSRRHQRAFIGYDLTREYWGRGLAFEAMREVVRFGFEQLDLHRLEAITATENARSIRLLERLGFKREGVRREYSLEADGTFRSSAIYGLLRDEHDRIVDQARPG